MAQIQDRKSDFYSHKQSVKDESSAPLYLESAGDVLIRDLAKKQLQTKITLEEQLEVTQHFEKGPEIHPNLLKGIKSLKEFKEEVVEETEEDKKCKGNEKVIQDVEDLKKLTGLSRRELELSLSEKPNSTISKLYHFAVTSKKRPIVEKSLQDQLINHPINHLKEIEEEYFGHLKKKKKSGEKIEKPEDDNEKKSKKHKKKRKHRKRKKKGSDQMELKSNRLESLTDNKGETSSTDEISKEKEKGESCIKPRSRVSLWDVKDMKKWCKSKEYTCKPQTLYTIKQGKIIKLEGKDYKTGDIT